VNNSRDVENIVFNVLRLNNKLNQPTESDLREAIDSAIIMISIVKPDFAFDEADKNQLLTELFANLHIKMDMGTHLVNKETFREWLPGRKAEIEKNGRYWPRYRRYLEEDKGWNHEIVERLGEVSDEILGLLGNPVKQGTWAGTWSRKGLLLGDIQSGKTSNYLALCNKAADAGYKVIILLTGTIETLRRQTQQRVDEGFVGRSSKDILSKKKNEKYIGVGIYDKNNIPVPFTSDTGDFNANKLNALNFTLNSFKEPVIFVLKKNKNILDNLKNWLRHYNIDNEGEKINLPLLLIDDEADNASVNTRKPEEDPTTINQGIRDILDLFSCKNYLGVTATPFANIFIDPEDEEQIEQLDLFPSDFIYALSPPTNYIGSVRVFGDEAEFDKCLEVIGDIIQDRDDPDENHFKSKNRSAHTVPEIPFSLKKSIVYFCLVNAIRDLDQRPRTHRSMMIHVSQYVNIQKQVFDFVKTYFDGIKKEIQFYAGKPWPEIKSNATMKLFNALWTEYRLHEKTGYNWDEIQKQLYDSITSIDIQVINQKSKQKLDYDSYSDTGLRVIAIGGNSLSRGLTLEGLCVSYFYRNSQMYDTLMQMGRWFGYRDGYEHLFKIWMAEETIGWYRYITKASEELREEIEEMRRLDMTPREFGLRVRQGIPSLFVTARNKMRNSENIERWINISGELIETPKLIASQNLLKDNLIKTNELIKKILPLREETVFENRILFKGVSKEIVGKFIREFAAHPVHIPFSSKDLSQHILNNLEQQLWDVAIIGGSGVPLSSEEHGKFISEEVDRLNIKLSERSITKNGNILNISGRNARLGTRSATKLGLTEKQRDSIEKAFKDKNEVNKKGKPKQIDDKAYLNAERKPLLLIYFVAPSNDPLGDDLKNIIGNTPLVGVGLGFPKSLNQPNSERVKYVINKVAMQSHLDYVTALEEEQGDEFD